MARKSSSGMVGLIFIGIFIVVAGKISESDGWGVIGVITGVAIGIFFIVQVAKFYSRIKYIKSKYPDPEIAKRILAGHIWQGQTSEQLIDSIGWPLDIDRKVLKTKKKEIWKYNSQGKNRYGLRITLENDVVIGWDKKA